MDGDGLDDYVYVHEQGAVAWFKNTGVADATHNPEWGLVHRVAAGVDVAPRDIQFGDTDGDGLIDYVTIGRVSGRATKWHNQGFAINSNGELYIKWSTPLPFAAGTGPGQTVRLADVCLFLFIVWCKVTRSDNPCLLDDWRWSRRLRDN